MRKPWALLKSGAFFLEPEADKIGFDWVCFE
jgi:hypothetical protein